MRITRRQAIVADGAAIAGFAGHGVEALIPLVNATEADFERVFDTR